MTVDTALLTIFGSVFVAMISLAGVVYAARSSRAANARSEVTKTWQAQLDALQRAVDGARMRADSWRDDVEALRADRDEDNARHAEEIAAVRGDLEKVKEQATQDRTARHELVSWARAVIALLRGHGITFPPPPPGVSDTDPGLIHVDHT